MSKIEEITKICRVKEINPSTRLTWIKLWLTFGSEEIMTRRDQLAKDVDENLTVFLSHYKTLREIGAIKTRARMASHPGVGGIYFKMVNPRSWSKKDMRHAVQD